MVDTFRRWVERALPWFDAEQYHSEAARQDAEIRDAKETETHARRTLDAYRRRRPR